MIFAAVLAAALAWASEGGPAPAPPSDAALEPSPAAAEAPPAEAVVTGSRLERGAAPASVLVIGRDEIEASGKPTVGDLLQSLPQQANGVNPQFNDFTSGATRVNLRSLGVARTLVLLNGRRLVPGGSGADEAVDLASIPSHAVERIEILTGGASAVYGSDAVAGVVNLVTRTTLDGSSAAAYAGTSSRGGGAVYDLGLTAGASGERGSILFSAGFLEQQEIPATDRGWSSVSLQYDFADGTATPQLSTYVPNGRFTLDPATCTNATCVDLFAHFGRTATTTFVADPEGGYAPLGSTTAYRPAGAADTYNYMEERYVSTPQQQIHLFVLGDTRLGGPARGYFEASYANRRSVHQYAPQALYMVYVNLPLSGDSYYNPFGTDLYDVRRRLVELGNQRFTQDVDTLRVVAGLDGTLPEPAGPLSGWSWDASYAYGRTSATERSEGSLRRPYLWPALGPSFLDPADGVVKCGTPGNVVPDCVPLNLLGGAGTISPEQIRYVGFTGLDRGTNALSTVSVVARGDLFRLGGGRPVGLALGYEYRHVSGTVVPDPIAAELDSAGNAALPVEGSYGVNELYGELAIPLASDLPLARELEATVAARWFDYTTSGSGAAYALGARWRVTNDVTIRGTYATAFRAPSIGELFRSSTTSIASAIDPCAGDPLGGARYIPPSSDLWNRCTENGAHPYYANNGDVRSMLRTIGGGYPRLAPETARTFTVGVVYEPGFSRNLSLAVDLHAIDLDEAVAMPGAETILNSCYEGDGRFCDRVSRDPTTGLIEQIDGRYANAGGVKTSGVDVAIRYALPTPAGRFGLAFDGTWLRRYDRTLPDGTVIEARGTYDEGALPEYRFNLAADWRWKGFGAGVLTRFVGSFEECANESGTSVGGLCYLDNTRYLGVPRLSREVGAWTSTDAYVSWEVGGRRGRTRAVVGVNNLLDRDPAAVYDGVANSDPATYDYAGRFFYVRLSHGY